ncbi:MAG: hypothetical protein AAGU76_06285 [Sedimentibacter sp.]|uniref:hypothetical protein n=1 Tax=Sedimentibacter sp. TaxID=1960295 RepID=UPI0031584B95
MDILGLIGQQYMFLLLVILFLGFGLGTWAVLKSLFSDKSNAETFKKTADQNMIKEKKATKELKLTKIIGGINMNNGWLKLGVFSLVGLVISISILSFVSNSNAYGMNMSNVMNTNNTMNVQDTMSMNGMNTQGTMNTNGMNTQGTMNMNGQTSNSSYDANIQNQLNQMQMQLNQLQMQLQNMMNSGNGQMQTPSTNTNSSGSMSMPMM